MIPYVGEMDARMIGAPRTSGDDPGSHEYNGKTYTCSPHERG